MKTLVVLCSVLFLVACSDSTEVVSHLKEFKENCSGTTETTVTVATYGFGLSAETSVKCIEEK
jgi:uridine phosphorylase